MTVAEDLYFILTTFMDGIDSVNSLNKYYTDNKQAVATLRSLSTRHYDQLKNDFKTRKKEILNEEEAITND